MRVRIEWLTQGDERVLEFLAEHDIVASPSVIAANIDYNASYISRRCTQLLDASLIRRADASNYHITELGERYLEGNLTEAEVEEIEAVATDDEREASA